MIKLGLRVQGYGPNRGLDYLPTKEIYKQTGDVDLKNIEREDNYIKENLTLNMAIRILEAAEYQNAAERLAYVFHYFPEIGKLYHWKIAKLTGLCRETVTRNIKSALEMVKG